MEDHIWRLLDSSKPLKRDQLELVVQKKKINEVWSWFEEHFSEKTTTVKYLQRCPIVIMQGPTGCGKTSTLYHIANSLNLTIKEYSETTDITAINVEVAGTIRNEEDRLNMPPSIDRRKAIKFEHFVINSIRYNTLYPNNDSAHSDADEFDSDEGMFDLESGPRPPPKVTGVIIHVETPLVFARSQRVLIQSLQRLLKVIKDISRNLLRRIAIVFETLEGEGEIISIPTKVKNSLDIKVFKFNPVIKTNMKKFIESLMKNYRNIVIERDTIDQIIEDSDGDLRACLNTLHLVFSKPTGGSVLNKINCNSLNGYLAPLPVAKKQKLNHEKVRQIRFDPDLMRDNTKGSSFFHVLGKIFYQKRFYPDVLTSYSSYPHKSLVRPYVTENSTNFLANMMNVESKNLISWLHQHYHKFCGNSSIEKASLFLEEMADIDTISLNSTQSSQFYEMQGTLNQLQIHLCIQSTVFTLYEDKSTCSKSSHKKVITPHGVRILKPSVENLTHTSDLYSFKKPTSINLSKVAQDIQLILSGCNAKLRQIASVSSNPTKVLLDYAPYIKELSSNWSKMDAKAKLLYLNGVTSHPVLDDPGLRNQIEVLQHFEKQSEVDYENHHTRLLEIIEDLDCSQEMLTERL